MESIKSSKKELAKIVTTSALIGAVGGAALYSTNEAIKSTTEQGLENIGQATYEQVAGSSKSEATYDSLQKGVIDLQIPPIDIEHSRTDK